MKRTITPPQLPQCPENTDLYHMSLYSVLLAAMSGDWHFVG